MKLLANLIRSRFWFVGMAASLALAGCGGGSGGGTASSGTLAAPSAVTVKVNADHSLSLDWPQADKAVAYNLYCSETSPVDQATAIKSINAASPFLLVAPASGTLNCVVTAIDGFGLTETTPSPPVRIVFPPAAPSNVQATAIPGTLALNWSPVPNAQGYRVYVFDKNETAFDKAFRNEATETPSFNVMGLTPGTAYRFVVTAYLKDGDTTRESVASEIKSQTPKAAIEPLAVNATAPRPDATGVIASTLNFVSVTFNRALNPASVNNQILTVTGPSGPVGGEVTLGSNADILKFTPGSTLSANKPYTVTVHKGIKDAEGLPLAEDYVFSFTTATVTTSGGGTVEQPPQVVGVFPIDNRTNVDPALAKIDVSFDKTMAVATINRDTLTVTRPDGSEVAGTVTYDQNGKTASFAPSSPFVANLQYTIHVSTGVKDSAGLPIAAAVASSFTTKLPTLNVSDVAEAEGGGSASVALTLDLVSGSPVVVDFTTVNDTATAPADFTAKSGSLTFAPGETSKAIVIPIVDDTLYETAEAFKVSFTNASGATLAKPQATVTLNDDDAVPVLNLVDLQVSESVGSANVVLGLNHPSAFPVTVDFATANGTAIEPSDYTKSTGRITFAPGETNKTITLAISDDTTYEATETLSVSLSNASGATSGKGQATVTINDNETIPAISVADLQVSESAGNASVVVSLNYASPFPITVDFATANGTAVAPADYTTTSGKLTFAAGETSKTIVVSIADDAIYETAESFSVTLSSPSGASITKSQATVTINDNDGLPALSVADLQVGESAGSANVVVSLNRVSALAVTVDFVTVNNTATAPNDFTAKTGSLTFAPGETSKQIAISIIEDAIYETAEGFKVVLSNVVGATLPNTEAVVTINDNDTLPALSVADLQVSESVGSASVVVNLNHPSAFPITVDFATANGTAVAPADYTATSGKLTFAAGETSKSIPVVIVNDTALEAAESLTLTLSNVSGATIADNSAIVTIQNDDAPAAPSVSLQNGDGQVTVNWADVAGATSYNIYYAKQTGVTPANYAAFTGGTAFINATSGRIITGLTNGTDHFFVVTALAGTLESGASPQRAAQPRGPAPVQPKLNDTGIDTCSTDTANGLACPQTGFLNQDGDFGRDAQARAGTLQKIGSGSAGFDYTKIGANGQVLASNASQWDCVRDNVTGLLWENKQAAGSKTLRDADYTYTWFSATNNGGNAGNSNGGVCFDTTHCDTEKFAAEVNKQGLCGYSDWRLPSIDELSTLVNRRIAAPGPTIETALFPATRATYYWSSSPYAEHSGLAWSVFFSVGSVDVNLKTLSYYVRLVRGQ